MLRQNGIDVVLMWCYGIVLCLRFGQELLSCFELFIVKMSKFGFSMKKRDDSKWCPSNVVVVVAFKKEV